MRAHDELGRGHICARWRRSNKEVDKLRGHHFQIVQGTKCPEPTVTILERGINVEARFAIPSGMALSREPGKMVSESEALAA